MPWAPCGANPPPAVKLPGWKRSDSSTTTVSTGTAVFQITVAELLSDNSFTPARLISVKIAISSVAQRTRSR